MTLKNGIMMLKIQLCITGINSILKYIQIENNNISLFLQCFRSNKCRLGEHERHLKQILLLNGSVFIHQSLSLNLLKMMKHYKPHNKIKQIPQSSLMTHGSSNIPLRAVASIVSV